MHYYGKGVSRNHLTAVRWDRKAAEFLEIYFFSQFSLTLCSRLSANHLICFQCHIQTLNEQMTNFSAEEIERARKTRKLHHAISAPGLIIMKKHFNQLCDNDIPWEDVVLAEK